MATYYAYINCTSDGVPFYVGKGSGDRYKNRTARSDAYKKHVEIKGRDILNGIIDCSSEDRAFELERGLIKCLRKMGVALVNVADGGKAISYWTGKVRSPETIQKIKATKAANPCTPSAAQQLALDTHRERAQEKSAMVRRKKIFCTTNNMIYGSAKEAAEATGCLRHSISSVASGKRASVWGFHFEYV